MNLNKDKWENYHKKFIRSYCVACLVFRAFDARSSKALFYWFLFLSMDDCVGIIGGVFARGHHEKNVATCLCKRTYFKFISDAGNDI